MDSNVPDLYLKEIDWVTVMRSMLSLVTVESVFVK